MFTVNTVLGTVVFYATIYTKRHKTSKQNSLSLGVNEILGVRFLWKRSLVSTLDMVFIYYAEYNFI